MWPGWPGCHSSRAETTRVSQGNNECFRTLPWKLTEQPSHQLRPCFSLEWPLSNLTYQLFFWILFPFRHLAVAPAKEAGIKMALEWVMGLRSWISHLRAWRHIPSPGARSLFVSSLPYPSYLSPLSFLFFPYPCFNDPSLRWHAFSPSRRPFLCFTGWLVGCLLPQPDISPFYSFDRFLSIQIYFSKDMRIEEGRGPPDRFTTRLYHDDYFTDHVSEPI